MGTSGERDPGVLERRYRLLLSLLPGSYRRLRGEEMISVLMDGSGPGRRWPRVTEAGSLLLLGLRTWSGVLVPLRARQSSAPLVRLIALWGTLYMAFEAVSDAARYREYPLFYRMMSSSALGLLHGGSAFFVYDVVIPACWLLVFAALLAGWRRAGRVLVAVAVLPVVLSPAFWRSEPAEVAMIAITGAAVFAASGPAARPVAGRRWWTAALVVLGAIQWESVTGDFGYGVWSYRTEVHTQMVLAGAIVLFVLAKGIRSPEWPLALAVLGVPPLADRMWFMPLATIGSMWLLGSEIAFVTLAGFVLVRNRMVARRVGGAES